MAMLNDAPFIKVEATKFTEVGYHGRVSFCVWQETRCDN